MKRENESENAGKKQDTRFKPGQSGNPAGKPPGTISILTDLKRRLTEIKNKDPEEYKTLIDDYWKDRRKRELLIKMIDGMPRGFSDSQNVEVNIGGSITDEEVLDEAYSLVAKDKGITPEELGER